LLPEITEPFLLIELETITVMYSGIEAGGPELLPGLLVQVPPQVAGFVLVRIRKSFKARRSTAAAQRVLRGPLRAPESYLVADDGIIVTNHDS
jgi:hypothetical protein